MIYPAMGGYEFDVCQMSVSTAHSLRSGRSATGPVSDVYPFLSR